MIDTEQRLALAELLQRTTPPAPSTARLVVASRPSEVLKQLRAGTAPTAAQNESSNQPVGLDAELEALQSGRYRLLASTDRDWPWAQFHELIDHPAGAPLGLWMHGEASLPMLLRRAVVITGARSSDPEANRRTAELAGRLAALGITIVSGGSYGIDDYAVRGALDEWGASVVVTPGGLESPQPPGHVELLDGVVANGGLLLSESPLDTRATPRTRAARTRIVAALGAVTVVVQGRADSHQFATQGFAKDLGRPTIAPTHADGPAHTLFDQPGQSMDDIVERVLTALPATAG